MLVITHSFNVDGANVALDGLLRAIPNLGTIDVVSVRGGDFDFNESLNIRKHILPGLMVNRLKNIFSGSFADILKFIIILSRHKKVIINTFDVPASIFYILHLFKKVILLYGHEGLASPYSSGFIGRRKLSVIKAMSSSNRMTVALPSITTVKDASKFLGIEVKRIRYWINEDECGGKKSFFNNGKVNFLVNGYICPRKSQEHLVRVFRDVESNIGSRKRDYTITFVGLDQVRDHSFIGFCLDNIPSRKVKFKFRMKRDELISELGQYDILLSNSYNEALPFNVLEFQAIGGCVIGTDCEGQDELLIDGETGLIYKIGDYAMLSKKINEVLTSDEAWIVNIGKRARQNIFETYSQSKAYNEFKEAWGSK